MSKESDDVAAEILNEVMLMVTMARAEKGLDVSASEITAYLQDKANPDVVDAIYGCDSLLKQRGGLINPEVITYNYPQKVDH